MSWQVIELQNEDGTIEMHVVPLDDLRIHESSECWCIPKIEDGAVVHNALDMREIHENETKH